MLSFIAMILCFVSIGVLGLSMLFSLIGVELMTKINFDDLSR